MSRNILNTSYKVQTDVTSDETRLSYNIEEGAIVTTSTGVWAVQGGEWVKLYPKDAPTQQLGWVRYDDTVYTSENKFTVEEDTEVVLPNNGGNIIRSQEGIDYYNPTTQKVLGSVEKDLYLATIVFKYDKAPAFSSTGHIILKGTNGTPYDRLHSELNFPLGAGVTHNHHAVFQYYIDAEFVTNGAEWRVNATGGDFDVWDIIFFFSKVQSYA
jgi:hypothetical protein